LIFVAVGRFIVIVAAVNITAVMALNAFFGLVKHQYMLAPRALFF
jgi:hypothetical protein